MKNFAIRRFEYRQFTVRYSTGNKIHTEAKVCPRVGRGIRCAQIVLIKSIVIIFVTIRVPNTARDRLLEQAIRDLLTLAIKITCTSIGLYALVCRTLR